MRLLVVFESLLCISAGVIKEPSLKIERRNTYDISLTPLPFFLLSSHSEILEFLSYFIYLKGTQSQEQYKTIFRLVFLLKVDFCNIDHRKLLVRRKLSLAHWFSLEIQVVEGLYCKRPIQCLASSEILTPHPLTARQVCIPSPLVLGEDTLARGTGGGGSIVRKTPDSALYSIQVSTL